MLTITAGSHGLLRHILSLLSISKGSVTNCREHFSLLHQALREGSGTVSFFYLAAEHLSVHESHLITGKSIEKLTSAGSGKLVDTTSRLTTVDGSLDDHTSKLDPTPHVRKTRTEQARDRDRLPIL
jgi:hypothetical protein